MDKDGNPETAKDAAMLDTLGQFKAALVKAVMNYPDLPSYVMAAALAHEIGHLAYDSGPISIVKGDVIRGPKGQKSNKPYCIPDDEFLAGVVLEVSNGIKCAMAQDGEEMK